MVLSTKKWRIKAAKMGQQRVNEKCNKCNVLNMYINAVANSNDTTPEHIKLFIFSASNSPPLFCCLIFTLKVHYATFLQVYKQTKTQLLIQGIVVFKCQF